MERKGQCFGPISLRKEGSRHLGLFVFGSILAWAIGLGCVRDLTADPKFGFTHLAGRCFVLQRDVFLCADDSWLMPPEFVRLPATSHDHYAEFWNGGETPAGLRVIGVVLAGTKIRIESLKYDPWTTMDPYVSWGRILDGRFAGRKVMVERLLADLEAEATNPPGEWKVNSNYLSPCDSAAAGPGV